MPEIEETTSSSSMIQLCTTLLLKIICAAGVLELAQTSFRW